MRSTEAPRPLRWWALIATALGLSACGVPRAPSGPADIPAHSPSAIEPMAPVPGVAPLSRSGRPADWTAYKMQAAMRLVAANPDMSYMGEVPDPLLAIPVLEIELNRDGSVRNINVQRVPRQAKDTVQLAIDAVKRAAPFGDVSHLPRPWKFSEVFLFNDDRRFKPRILDQ
ncbi:hypothetical protein [Azohydromonas caseinilytica]|uniref:Uncharacterized protein n=1 Tax=Azohydromonas caseinilytica TaxID=2728836 RepID=A0A848F5Y3_9BURK|nr:hypothetical protein [Azohydromonas caseinilytica]NML14558.1 hypothetical protein [Azohydromonas caseinilytica]